MKIVFCSSEVFPFVKTGGLADVGGALPLALEQAGIEVMIFLPLYKAIDRSKFNITQVSATVSTTKIGTAIDVYFIENEKYFSRDGIYGDSHGDYPDNLDRFQFFSEQVLEFLRASHIKVDLIHCHDWQTALIPVYLKEKYCNNPVFENTKSLLTIHNMAYQGVFSKKEYVKIKLKEELFGVNGFEFFGQINLLKAGILYADVLTTVSPQYAKEIQAKEFGCGLDGVIRSRKTEVVGILNGIDGTIWNPQTDALLEYRYGPADAMAIKPKNKTYLQQRLDLPVRPDVPLLGFVARLTHQKGIDLLLEAIDDLVDLDLQIIIQGVGESKYHAILNTIDMRYPKDVAVCLAFDEKIAHQIYVGCDLFLMPSLFEPCGLSQMISLRYGTIPIVYKTGGLADSIKPFSPRHLDGNGFLFERYKKDNFVDAVKKAIDLYHDHETFSTLINNAFHSQFGWEQSAQKYIKAYQCLLSV